MTTLKIEIPAYLDQEQAATAMEAIAAEIRTAENLEDRELMDGSIRLETPVGAAFVTFELE